MYRRQLGLETVRRATTRDELSPVRWDATKAYDPGWGGHGCLIEEADIPLRAEVRGICQLLGFNPLQLACEGRVVAIVAADSTDEVLARWRALPEGGSACRAGRIVDDKQVVLRTVLGGQRFLDELADDPLPRIC